MACVYVANHLLCAPATRATDDTVDRTFVAFPLQSYGDFELGEALTKIVMVDLLDGHNLIHQVFNFFLILDLFLTFVTLFGQFSIYRCFCFDILCYYCRGQTRSRSRLVKCGPEQELAAGTLQNKTTFATKDRRLTKTIFKVQLEVFRTNCQKADMAMFFHVASNVDFVFSTT